MSQYGDTIHCTKPKLDFSSSRVLQDYKAREDDLVKWQFEWDLVLSSFHAPYMFTC